MLMSILIALTLAELTNITNAENIQKTHYNITRLDSSGVFFKEIFKTYLYTDEATLFTKIEIPKNEPQIKIITDCSKKLSNICNKIITIDKTNLCKNFMTRLFDEITDIMNNDFLIHHTVKRTKRGLLNIIGSTSKLLFGTMDENDATEIRSELNDLHSNSVDTIRLVQDQVAVIKSNFQQLTKPTLELQTQSKHIREKIDDLEYEIDNAHNVTETLRRGENFLEIANLALVMCMALDKNQNKIFTILDNLHMNRIHPLILTSDNIETTVRKMNIQLNKNVINTKNIMTIADVEYTEHENDIFIKITLPLPKIELSTAYKPFTTPIRKNNSYYILDFKNEYIVTDDEKNTLTTLTKDNVKDCKKIRTQSDGSVLLCKQSDPIFHTPDDNCMLRIFHNPHSTEKLTAKCTKYYRKISLPRYQTKTAGFSIRQENSGSR